MERKELSTVLYPVLIIHFEKMNEVEVFFCVHASWQGRLAGCENEQK
jgi:hypothetical protein